MSSITVKVYKYYFFCISNNTFEWKTPKGVNRWLNSLRETFKDRHFRGKIVKDTPNLIVIRFPKFVTHKIYINYGKV